MIQIRSGQQEDIEEICKILIQSWQQNYVDFIPKKFLASLNLERQIQRHQKYFKKGVQYYIAENAKNEILGFASVGENRLIEIEDSLELHTMYVRNNHQGKGIGAKILERVFKDVNENESLLVQVFSSNPFKNFYEKNNFFPIGEQEIDMGTFKLAGTIYRWNR